ncbi:MAG TPA: GAF domain-containing protein, partial [bacterium]|nr:GAF domain-containing protein [bacterium]
PLFTSAFSAAENGAPLGQLLQDQLRTGSPLGLERIEFPAETNIQDAISVRSLPWDLDSARSRRILLWIRRERREKIAGAPREWREETPQPVPPAAVLEASNDRYFTLKAFLEKLLESLPLGVCLLDPSLRVVAENDWMRTKASGDLPAESGFDRHLFSQYPNLRDDSLQSALDRCRTTGESQSIVLLSSALRTQTLLVDLHACLPEGDTQGILLLVRDTVAALTEAPSAIAAPAQTPAGEAVADSDVEAPVLQSVSTPLPFERPELVEIESLELSATDELEPAAHVITPPAVKSVILLGAAHGDVPVLRLLYRSPSIHIRMIFDPDPEAFGLSLGRSLGIPVLSGDLQVQLESPPDAVVLSRGGLEKYLERLGLESISRITRDETELFLVDPDGFLASEGAVFEAVPEERIDTIERTVPPGPLSAPAIEKEELEPAYAAAPAPAPSAPLLEPELFSSVNGEVQSILRALDLLLDFQKLADWVLDSAMRISSAVSGSLMLLKEEKPVLSIVASRGLKDIAVRHRRQRVGEGIAGRVAEDGEPLLLVGTVGDPKLKPMGARPEIRSSVSVPVIAESGVVGVLNLNSDPVGRHFNEEDLETVGAFGRQLGSALARSLHLRKLRTRAFEQSMCSEITAIGDTHSELGMKLRQVADRVVRVLNADSCTIYLLNRDKDALNLEAGSGVAANKSEAVTVPLGTGVVGWVAKSRRPLVLRNPDEEIGDPQPTTMAFPIRHQTDLLGVLLIEASQATTSEEDRLALIEAISSAIGVLIVGALSAQLSERKVTMLSALSELGLAFSAASHRKGLARLVAFTASTVLESDVGLVRLRRADSHSPIPEPADLELIASHGASFPEESEPLCQLESLLMKRAMQSGHPVSDLDLPLSETESLLRQSNVFTAMAVPMTNSAHAVVGSILVCRVADSSGKGTPFGASEMDVARRLADYAAAAAVKFPGHPDDDGKDEAEEE